MTVDAPGPTDADTSPGAGPTDKLLAGISAPEHRHSVRPQYTITPDRYRTVTAFALWALAGIVVTGAAVRLTGSGLGCTDWPTCRDGRFVADLGRFHDTIEFVNRCITGLVSVAVMAAVLGSLRRRPYRRDLMGWSVSLVLGVVAQALLGAATTLSGLHPAVVAGHYLLSVVLITCAVILHHHAGSAEEGGVRTPAITPPVRLPSRWIDLLAAATVLVLCTGPIVTGTGPHGGDEHARRFGMALTTVARAHSLTVWLLVAVFVTLAVKLRDAQRRGAPLAAAMDRLRDMGAAMLAQGVLGYVQYALHLPAMLVGLHVAGSVLVLVTMLRLRLQLNSPGRTAP